MGQTLRHDRSRLDSLDALRALACIGIVSFHSYLSMLGYLGVSVFFMLSGFLMLYSYFGVDTADSCSPSALFAFALSKIKRLVPLHLVMAIIPFAEQMYGLLSGLAQPSWAFFRPIVLNLLLVQAWVPIESCYFSMNIPSWYLSTAIFMYLLFPLILRCIRRYSKLRQAVVSVFAIYALQFAAALLFTPNIAALDHMLGQEYGVEQWFLYVFPLFRLGDFAIGCNLGYIFLHIQDRPPHPAAATAFEVFSLAAAALTELPAFLPALPVFLRFTLSYSPISAALILSFAFGAGKISGLLTNRVTKYISRLSPYIFLIHYVVINVVTIIVTRLPLSFDIQHMIYIVCVFAFTFAFSALWDRFRIGRKAKS